MHNVHILFRPALAFALSLLCGLSLAQAPDLIKERLAAPADPLQYRDTVRQAINLYTSQKPQEAVAKFKEALDAYPLDGYVWTYYAFALRAAALPKEAIAAFDKGHELKSTWQGITTYYWLARTYLDIGDKEGALRTLEHLVFQEPYVRRPDLYDDPAFASIKNEPRFLKVAGRVDTSKMSRTEGWRTDIDYVIAEIKRVNHRYKDEPLPKETLIRCEQLKRDVPKLTDDEIFVRLGNMLAPLNQAHTTLALLPESKVTPAKNLPVRLYAFPEGVFVVGSDPLFTDLIGSQVLKVEGVAPAEILAKMEKNRSVENGMRVLWSAQEMTYMQMLRGLGVLAKGKEEVRLTLRSKSGEVVDRVLKFGTYQHPRKLGPAPGVTPPLFTKDVQSAHWFEPVPGEDALFVQLNQVTNDTDETIASFGLRLRKQLAEHPTKNLILDLRHNNGGNTSLYRELLRTLVAYSTIEGNRLYALIGRGVYSATGNLICDLERLASPIFVGEPTSGFGNQDGDESFVILPYSGIRGWLASVWWQTSHPWDRRTSMMPDIPVQLTAKAYFAGQDPVLETVLAAIHRG